MKRMVYPALLRRGSIKEAFDFLPSGICFFGGNGIPLLCNQQMHHLSFSMLGKDLQHISELEAALENPSSQNRVTRDGDLYILPDQTVWSFTKSLVTDEEGSQYTEIIASNMTELYEKQKMLEQSNIAQQKIVASIKRTADHVASITREEEILSMKMRIHNELGYRLEATRKFLAAGCPINEKASFASGQKKLARSLMGELESGDEVDLFAELQRVARSLDMEIVLNGALPKEQPCRELILFALRECLTNTLRHADGSKVFACLTRCKDTMTVTITNNGIPPARKITEGGGLSSLRHRIENAGGKMYLKSLPAFALTLILPERGDKL